MPGPRGSNARSAVAKTCGRTGTLSGNQVSHGHDKASLERVRRRPACGVLRAFDALRPCHAEAGRPGAPSQGVQRETECALRPPDLDRGEGVHQLRRPVRAACEGVHTPRRQQFPRGRPSGYSVDPSGHARAQGSRPQVSMVGNLGKAEHRAHGAGAPEPQGRS